MMHGGSPLRKLEVLEALDKAKTQWYHFTTIIVAGAGFFTDAYDLFCISTVTSLLGRIYYSQPATGKPGVLPINVLAAVNAVALCGTLVGNVVFGWLGDKIGRRTVYGWTLTLMIVCSIGSGISFGSTAKSVMATICFFRFWLGFGIGGDYPLSATIMSEYSNIRTRGAFIAAVFAMQGFGILSGATVGIIVSSVFMHAYPRGSFLEDPTVPSQADYVWRIILMLGAVPAAVTLYYRLRLPETARYTALVQGDIDKAGADMVAGKMLDVQHTARGTGMENWKPRIPRLLSMEFAAQHGWQLLATGSCWFLLDVSFFSQNLFQKDIFIAVGWLPPPADMSALEELFRISRASALIALCATIPGYWVTVFTVEWLGRRFVQMQGFFFMAVFMLIIALEFQHFRGYSCSAPEGLMSGSFCGGNHVGFVLLYAVIFFFSNFGPNATTFIIPAELFPASLRATCFGISAAAGKLGAIVGAFGFLYARQARSKHDPDAEAGYPAGIGVKLAYVMLAGVNVVGFLVTALLTPETKGKSLEALSRDLHVDVGRTEDRMPLSEEFDPSGEMRQAQQVPRSPGLRKVQVYSMI